MGMIQLWEGRKSVWMEKSDRIASTVYRQISNQFSFRFGAQIAGHKTQVKDGKQQLGK